MKKNYFKKVSLLLFSAALAIPLSSCSITSNSSASIDSITLANKNYQYESQYSDQILQRTLSLKFKLTENQTPGDNQIETTTVTGTGWIWSASNNYYYVATNMHVAGSVTFAGNKFAYYPEGSKTPTIKDYTNYQLSSQLGYSSNGTSINYVDVLNPTVVYSSINDTNFNSIVNPNNSYYQYSNYQFKGISDIVILRYDLNPADYDSTTSNSTSLDAVTENTNASASLNPLPSDFQTWLSNYNNNPTNVYNGSISLSGSTFYSGGFPVIKDQNGAQSNQWVPLSGFGCDINVTSQFDKSWNSKDRPDNESDQPISFIDSNYANQVLSNTSNNDNNLESANNAEDSTKPNNDYSSNPGSTNFLNKAYNIYCYGNSSAGASGSLLSTVINNTFYVVGIYWGVTTFKVNNSDINLGSYDLFVNPSYNLVNSINQAISSDKPTSASNTSAATPSVDANQQTQEPATSSNKSE
ncbi:MAG: hypothetical protein HUJ42_02615 [Malacoplasma sp.]|nr:hypothetical protein [Malacoplasma sp.]